MANRHPAHITPTGGIVTSPIPTPVPSSAIGSDIILEARDVIKRYPGNLALDHVTFRVHRNAVNVLIGENGAGKSTLMRILAGVEGPDGGTILLDGKPVELRSPKAATAHGISIVHQELALMQNLDIAENVFAGCELTRNFAFVDRLREDLHTSTALEHLHRPMAAKTRLLSLSLGRRQIVELARTLAHGAKIVILDEPTSALSMAETNVLFQVIEDLKRSGVTIIYISHRLYELLELGDHFTVLRGGRIVGDAPRHQVNHTWIVERMSGYSHAAELQKLPAQPQEQTLSVQNLHLSSTTEDEAAPSPLTNVSFCLQRGEILGIYGLLGSGRTELLEALAGARRYRGKILLDGRHLSLNTVCDAVKAGIMLVPEDRQRDGLIPDLSIRENIALAVSRGLFLSRATETTTVRAIASELNLAAHNLELPVTSLSGGNQQKVLLARCLMRSPKVLLLDEPTRGVDVGTKREIYRILKNLAAQGLSVLFTSSEIEETRMLADRVLVLCQGSIAGEFTRLEFTDEALFVAASPHRPEARTLVEPRG
jgi:erythritol transport system ATP-binding protein